ncbi:MAG: DUF3099 domain-containing protein [Nocardioides sp.]
MSRRVFRRTLGRRRGARTSADVVRITTAGANPADGLRSRQRRYLIAKLTATACLVGGVLIGEGWLRWVLVAAAVLLPFPAVILATASETKADQFTIETPRANPPTLPRVSESP